MKTSELKVKGGKLVKCRLEVEDGCIKSIRYIGDFFLHPEESIERLEALLTGVKATGDKVKYIIEDFFKDSELKLIGAAPADFITVTLNCLEDL
ncbi:MAG: lipoate protein ligase C-terminal domain-containing protein [Candidatus Odinarchaeota archaeon]